MFKKWGFLLLSAISSVSVASMVTADDSITGWYYYDGKDTSVIEFTEPEVYYIGKDDKGYYMVNYKNDQLKEKNKTNLKICKVDSREHVNEEFRYFSTSDITEDTYSRKLTEEEALNVEENLKTAEQSKEICDIG